eukprot:548679_1
MGVSASNDSQGELSFYGSIKEHEKSLKKSHRFSDGKGGKEYPASYCVGCTTFASIGFIISTVSIAAWLLFNINCYDDLNKDECSKHYFSQYSMDIFQILSIIVFVISVLIISWLFILVSYCCCHCVTPCDRLFIIGKCLYLVDIVLIICLLISSAVVYVNLLSVRRNCQHYIKINDDYRKNLNTIIDITGVICSGLFSITAILYCCVLLLIITTSQWWDRLVRPQDCDKNGNVEFKSYYDS